MLDVKIGRNASGARAHRKLYLEDVLHVPEARCNIIAVTPSFDAEYTVAEAGQSIIGSPEQAWIVESNDKSKTVCYVDLDRGFRQIRVSGPPYGPVTGRSKISKQTSRWLGIVWEPLEMKRWEAEKKALARPPRARGKQPNTAPPKVSRVQAVPRTVHKVSLKNATKPTSPPYSREERRWLKANFGGEYHFLKNEGLSIFKDKHQEQGRLLAREMMAKESLAKRQWVDEVLSTDDEGDSESDDDIGSDGTWDIDLGECDDDEDEQEQRYQLEAWIESGRGLESYERVKELYAKMTPAQVRKQVAWLEDSRKKFPSLHGLTIR